MVNAEPKSGFRQNVNVTLPSVDTSRHQHPPCAKNTEVCHRMKRLIIADVSPKQFRYSVAALVLSVVFTLMSSSSLKSSRQYGAGLSFIVTFCYIVWLWTHFFRTSLSVFIAWITFSAFPFLRQCLTRDNPSIKAKLATLVISSILVTVMAMVVYSALILHNS